MSGRSERRSRRGRPDLPKRNGWRKRAQLAGVNPALGLRVGRIEAPHEADHRHLTGVVGRGGDRAVAIGRVERQGFLAGYLFAGVD
jgi:hypothetical protein